MRRLPGGNHRNGNRPKIPARQLPPCPQRRSGNVPCGACRDSHSRWLFRIGISAFFGAPAVCRTGGRPNGLVRSSFFGLLLTLWNSGPSGAPAIRQKSQSRSADLHPCASSFPASGARNKSQGQGEAWMTTEAGCPSGSKNPSTRNMSPSPG